MSKEHKWGWWYTDSAEPIYIFDAEDQAHDAAKADIGEGPERTYWICKMQNPLYAALQSPMRIGEHSLKTINKWLYAETGADIDVIEFDAGATVDLGNLILDFLKKRSKVKCWIVDEKSVKEYSYGGVE